MSYQRKQSIRDSALDSCGIGHDVQDKFILGSKKIAEVSASLFGKCQDQLTHNLLTNAPCGIDVGDPIEHAVEQGIASFVGNYSQYDVMTARKIAALILQDVNDHKTAAMLFEMAKSDAA